MTISVHASESVKSGAKHVEAIPLNGYIGAEIRGVDLRKDLTEEEFNAVHEAFVKYEVIVLRNQNITLDQQIAFAERFGKLTIHPFAPKSEGGRREVIHFDHNEANPPALTDCWHSDETFRECPPMATMLRCLVAPAAGGDTLFSSMTAAYRGLSERMKQYIHGLEALHDFKPWRSLFNTPALKSKLRLLEDEYPNVWHPVVRVHPVSGKRVLFVNPQFTVRMKDMGQDESDALLQFLYRQAHCPEYQLRVKWEPHTIVMWDNRSTQHYASHDYYPQRRKMERVTIGGDKVVGVSGPYTPETIPSNGMVRPKVSGASGPKRDFELY